MRSLRESVTDSALQRRLAQLDVIRVDAFRRTPMAARVLSKLLRWLCRLFGWGRQQLAQRFEERVIGLSAPTPSVENRDGPVLVLALCVLAVLLARCIRDFVMQRALSKACASAHEHEADDVLVQRVDALPLAEAVVPQHADRGARAPLRRLAHPLLQGVDGNQSASHRPPAATASSSNQVAIKWGE